MKTSTKIEISLIILCINALLSFIALIPFLLTSLFVDSFTLNFGFSLFCFSLFGILMAIEVMKFQSQIIHIDNDNNKLKFWINNDYHKPYNLVTNYIIFLMLMILNILAYYTNSYLMLFLSFMFLCHALFTMNLRYKLKN